MKESVKFKNVSNIFRTDLLGRLTISSVTKSVLRPTHSLVSPRSLILHSFIPCVCLFRTMRRSHPQKSAGANLQHNRQMSHNSNNSRSVLPGVGLCVGTRHTMGYWLSDWINGNGQRGQTCWGGWLYDWHSLTSNPSACADYGSSVLHFSARGRFPLSARRVCLIVLLVS